MPKFLQIVKPAAPASKAFPLIRRPGVPAAPAVHTGNGFEELLGKAVFFSSKGERIAGKAVRVQGKKIVVRLAVPNSEGLLVVSDSEVEVKPGDLEASAALTAERKMKAWEAGVAIKLPEDKKALPVYEFGPDGKPTQIVCDYRDVSFDGYASTFVSTTPADRIGDYILPGAFDKTLADFKQNPVCLTDHDNECAKLLGSFDKLMINSQGLAVHANVTNAPGMRDIRFKLVEGHLKGLSIGGLWYYLEDGRGIEEATLFEISVVPVPMNPDALLQARSITPGDCRKAFKKFWSSRKQLKEAA